MVNNEKLFCYLEAVSLVLKKLHKQTSVCTIACESMEGACGGVEAVWGGVEGAWAGVEGAQGGMEGAWGSVHNCVERCRGCYRREGSSGASTLTH